MFRRRFMQQPFAVGCVSFCAAVWLVALSAVAWGQAAPEVAYYSFDEGSGATTANLGDPGIGLVQAEFNSAPTWVGDAALGDFAVGLDGSTHLFTGIDTAILSNTDFTISFWIRASSINERQAILSDGGDFGIYVFHQSGQVLIYDDTTDAVAWSGVNVVTGDWVHVAFTYVHSTQTISSYVNGWQVLGNQPFEHNISSGIFYLFEGNYTLNLQGGTQPISYFDQELDEFRIWTHARTNYEVRFFHDLQAPLPQGLYLSRLEEPISAQQMPVNPHHGNVLAGSMIAYAVNEQQLDQLVIDNAGTATHGVEVVLYEGPGINYNPAMLSELGRAPLVNGSAVIEVDPGFVLPDRGVAYLFLAFAAVPGAVGGTTFAAQLAEGASVSVSDGSGYAATVPFAFEWTTNKLFGPFAGLPAFADFAQIPDYLQFHTGAGLYPTAQSAGDTVDMVSVTSTTNARLRFGKPSVLQPVSAASAASVDFPQGVAYGALELHYDVSNYNLAAIPLWLRFYWNNIDLISDDGSHVFVSIDGGATWLTSLYRFELPQESRWQHISVDVAQAIADAGADAKDVEDLVIRFQARDIGPFNQRGLLIDNVSLALGSHLRVTRVGRGIVPNGSTDDWGEIAGPGNTTARYALENVGISTLEIIDLRAHDFADTGSGQDSLVTSFSQPFGLAPGEIRIVDVDVSLADAGSVGFELEITTNDPILPGGIYFADIVAEATNLAPTIRRASWAKEISGNQADGFAYEVRVERPLVNVTLIVEDPNGDPIEVVRVEGNDVDGVQAPLAPIGPTSGSVELTWTGIAFPAGRHRYTIEVTDGSLSTTTTLELLFDSPVADHIPGVSCGATTTAQPRLDWGLALLVLLLGALLVRRRKG